MTECERFIAEGFLQKDFFKEEVRCDFLVTTERKKLWAIGLDLLNQVDAVCRKHGLQYFLFFGSLLGAVRHHGFIPWDDDIDIILPREDYEKLLVLKDEFSYPYFLQTPYTDCGFYFSFAKLRNCRTTEFNYTFLYQGFNLGIGIDIFPLDDVESDGVRERFERIHNLIMDNSTAMRLTHPALPLRDQKRVRNYAGNDPISTYEEIQKLANPGANKKSDLVASMVSTRYAFDKYLYKREDFSSQIEWNFEGIRTYIPAGYDRILTTYYGDYRSLPPVEERGQWHGDAWFNPDIPYNVVVEKAKAEIDSILAQSHFNETDTEASGDIIKSMIREGVLQITAAE